MCWKCKLDLGTFQHCIWDCRFVHLFWAKDCLNNWSGTIVPLTPAVCLLEDRPQGALVTASGLYCSILFFTLKHQKSALTPNVKERTDAWWRFYLMNLCCTDSRTAGETRRLIRAHRAFSGPALDNPSYGKSDDALKDILLLWTRFPLILILIALLLCHSKTY